MSSPLNCCVRYKVFRNTIVESSFSRVASLQSAKECSGLVVDETYRRKFLCPRFFLTMRPVSSIDSIFGLQSLTPVNAYIVAPSSLVYRSPQLSDRPSDDVFSPAFPQAIASFLASCRVLDALVTSAQVFTSWLRSVSCNTFARFFSPLNVLTSCLHRLRRREYLNFFNHSFNGGRAIPRHKTRCGAQAEDMACMLFVRSWLPSLFPTQSILGGTIVPIPSFLLLVDDLSAGFFGVATL